MNARDKMSAARIQLLAGHPFFAMLALKLKLQEERGIKTADVDGKTLRYNPDWIDKLELPEVVGLNAHEVMHCAVRHMLRRGSRDPQKWNLAADYEINRTLKNANFQLPDGGAISDAFKDMTAEAIYALLPDMPGDSGGEGQGGGAGEDPGGCGGVRDAPSQDGENKASPAEMAEQEADWKLAVAQAAQVAKARGKLPAELEKLVEELLEAKVDWQSVLRRFISASVPTDYSWTRPNRRFVAQGLYLPSVHKEGVGKIVIGNDTSGSISDELLQQFAGEINMIVKEVRPEEVVVVHCDAMVHHVQRFQPDEDVVLEAKGRGGTDFRPVFDWVEQNGEEPRCLIYLTDMYGGFPDDPPSYPVLWASTSGVRDAPFGEVVPIE